MRRERASGKEWLQVLQAVEWSRFLTLAGVDGWLKDHLQGLEQKASP